MCYSVFSFGPGIATDFLSCSLMFLFDSGSGGELKCYTGNKNLVVLLEMLKEILSVLLLKVFSVKSCYFFKFRK